MSRKPSNERSHAAAQTVFIPARAHTRMKDIAEALDLAVITVSKALRDHSDISCDTKQRVWDKARELNYMLNLAARSLVM